VSGILVDRQEAIDAAAPRFQRERLADRCKLLAADLRNEVPAGADVYTMQHVLHGYDDAAAIEILSHCRAVLAPEGRLLVIEFVLPDVVDHADAELEHRLMSDLNMLAVTGGKERSAVQWKGLLNRAGLQFQSIIPVPGDPVAAARWGSASIVEAARAVQ
jgi:O-methyltransferase domain